MNNIKSNSFIVKPFLLHSMKDDSLVLQVKDGIFRLNNSCIIKIVKTLTHMTEKKIDLNWIKGQGVKNPSDILEYLLSIKVIDSKGEYNFNIKKINFLSNSKVVKDFVSYSFKDLEEFTVYDDQRIFLSDLKENKKEFYFVFLNQLNKKNSKQLRDAFMNSENSLSIISYIYNNNLYIDSLYSPKWKLPCHLCNLELIESEHRVGLSTQITYQQIIDEIFMEDNTFSIQMKFEPRHELNIATQICNRIEKLITFRNNEKTDTQDFTRGVFFNLSSNKMSQGNTHHWELCDCYE